MSEYALMVNLQKFAAIPEDAKREQRKKAGRSAWSAEARSRRSATLFAKNGPPEHGTQRMYRGRGCRCAACREWNRRTHEDYLRRRG